MIYKQFEEVVFCLNLLSEPFLFDKPPIKVELKTHHSKIPICFDVQGIMLPSAAKYTNCTFFFAPLAQSITPLNLNGWGFGSLVIMGGGTMDLILPRFDKEFHLLGDAVYTSLLPGNKVKIRKKKSCDSGP